MSAKNAQGSVDERRLRPIYDLLDNSNYKKAIQEADKVLKKQPNLLCAKVLKALALLRFGKENESSELLESVRKEKPTDDATLQGMAMCYSDLNRYEQICELYEAAFSVQPKNEDIIANLFSAYVRIGDYKKQRITALTLTKVRQKGQYYFWAAMSILLQALTIDELTEYCMPPLCEFKEPFVGEKRSDANATLLTWVQKIIDKMISEDKIESPGEALICPIAPEALRDYPKALEILDSLSSKIQNKIPLSTVNKKKVDLLIKMKQWDKANILLKKLLTEEPDSWVLIQYYLESVFRTMEDSVNEMCIDNSFEKACKFINKLLEDNKTCKKRGPYLAKLELYKRWLLAGSSGIEISDYVEELSKYFKEWGHLDCCARDMAPYLPNLPRTEMVGLLSTICHEVGVAKNATPSSTKQVALHLTNLELARYSNLFPSLSPEETSKLISYLVNCFLATQETTRQSDRYILLCIHYLHDAYLSTESADYLYEALVLVHLGLTFNKDHKQFRLCLVKLYHCLGASSSAHKAYTSLDVKHMQVDSLGYLHVWPTIATGNFPIALELISNSLKFFNNNYKDSVSQVVYAYKFDVFTKIPEFIGIKDCLNNSFQYRLVKVENLLANVLVLFSPDHSNNKALCLNSVRKVVNEMDYAALFKDMDWSNMYDNRDLNVFWFMDGEDKKLSQKEVEGSLGRELVLLRGRCLVGKWIAAVVNTRWRESGKDSGEDTGYESGASEGSGGIEEVAKEIEAMLATGAPIGRSQLFSDPPPSRLDTMLSIRYFQPLIYQAHLISALLGDNSDPEKAQFYINLIFVYFHEICEHLSKMRRDPSSRANFLTVAILLSELLTLTTLLVKVLESVLNPSTEKKNKKKRDQQEESTACWKDEITSDLQRCCTTHIETILNILRRELQAWADKPVDPPLVSISLDNSQSEHNTVLSSCATEVTSNITSSHTKSLQFILSVFTQLFNHLT